MMSFRGGTYPERSQVCSHTDNHQLQEHPRGEPRLSGPYTQASGAALLLPGLSLPLFLTAEKC